MPFPGIQDRPGKKPFLIKWFFFKWFDDFVSWKLELKNKNKSTHSPVSPTVYIAVWNLKKIWKSKKIWSTRFNFNFYTAFPPSNSIFRHNIMISAVRCGSKLQTSPKFKWSKVWSWNHLGITPYSDDHSKYGLKSMVFRHHSNYRLI